MYVRNILQQPPFYESIRAKSPKCPLLFKILQTLICTEVGQHRKECFLYVRAHVDNQ